jgi:peptidoglycan hydrolase-like protein with peptidoglycan-binding domain
MSNLRTLYKSTEDIKLTSDELKKDKELVSYIQDILIDLDFLPANGGADGILGPNTTAGILRFAEDKNICLGENILNKELIKSIYESQQGYLDESTLKLSNDFASRIVKYMIKKGYELYQGSNIYNVVYVEDCTECGKSLPDQPDYFNDRRLLIQILNGKPTIIANYKCTTEPGRYYTKNRMNRLGAARIKFGSYKAWKLGYHGSRPYRALVQCMSIPVHRDNNENFARDKNDKITWGLIGLNQHHGYNNRTIYVHSAGCLTAQSSEGHFEWMDLIENDKRVKKNRSHIIVTSILPGDKI